jgi:hypothetical protein
MQGKYRQPDHVSPKDQDGPGEKDIWPKGHVQGQAEIHTKGAERHRNEA